MIAHHFAYLRHTQTHKHNRKHTLFRKQKMIWIHNFDSHEGMQNSLLGEAGMRRLGGNTTNWQIPRKASDFWRHKEPFVTFCSLVFPSCDHFTCKRGKKSFRTKELWEKRWGYENTDIKSWAMALRDALAYDSSLWNVVLPQFPISPLKWRPRLYAAMELSTNSFLIMPI